MPVAITGLGVVTPAGVGIAPFWRSLVEGPSGIGPIRKFDASAFPVRLAAEVSCVAAALSRSLEAPPEAVDLPTRFAVAAAEMAWADAGLGERVVRPERAGLFLGVGGFHLPEYRALSGLAAGMGEVIDAALVCRQARRVERRGAALLGAPITPALAIGRRLSLGGPVAIISTACAAGAQAIGEAKRCLERGDADVAVAGGTEEGVSPIKLLFFSMLGVLSRRTDLGSAALRPFHRRRDGTVLGDGAGIVVLETLERARRRGARVYAELAGYGASGDAYRLTDSPPDGSGAALAMARALADARIHPEAVDYVNAHGTGTVANDQAEAMAIRRVFGPRVRGLPISSTKPITGHLVTAAGAVECIATALSLARGVIPPTMTCDDLDPDCRLHCVPLTARSKPLAVALSNSFGFGGQNVALVLRRSGAEMS
jgi:3-oxoacyl-[acyl-carrier-protein] synthase II